MNTFIEFLENIERRMIDPETSKPYRHGRLLIKLEEIMKDEIAKGVPEDNIWVNFSDIPRLSAAPLRAYSDSKTTPHGIFAYPLKYFIKRGTVPYAGDRDYCIVFKSKVPIWDIGKKFNEESNNEWARELIKRGDLTAYFPEKKKLLQIASKLGIDLLPIASSMATQYVLTHARHYDYANNVFIYRVLERMAHIWAETDKIGKNLSWPMRWNKLLRMMGKSNVVDLQNTGHIHESEKTQGVFVNPKDLEVIEIIVNKSGVSQEQEVGEFKSWVSNKSHDVGFIKKQRLNPLRYNYRGEEDIKKRQIGLIASFKQIIKKFHEEVVAWDRWKWDTDPAKELFFFKNKLKVLLKLKNNGLDVRDLVSDIKNLTSSINNKSETPYKNILGEIVLLLSKIADENLQ